MFLSNEQSWTDNSFLNILAHILNHIYLIYILKILNMLRDCHAHSNGSEKAEEVVRAMEEAGVDQSVITSPYPRKRGTGIDPKPTGYMQFSYSGVDEQSQLEAIRFISNLQAEFPDKIVAFAWIEPRLKNAPKLIEEAVTKYECKGIKMIPDHWYPWETEFFPVYGKIQELGVPVLFHSGILYGFKDSSRFCRPCNYEVLVNFPQIRFALAHMSWPWTDECIALFGRFRANLESNPYSDKRANKMQLYLDTTPGTPNFYRREAFKRALMFGAEDYMLFGSDSSATNFSSAKETSEMDRGIIRELGYSEDTIKKILSENFKRFIKG